MTLIKSKPDFHHVLSTPDFPGVGIAKFKLTFFK
jgi:hypothetical protein